MLSKHQLLVRTWHKAFKIEPITKEEEIPGFFELRSKLFIEEYEEYFEAGNDTLGKADAIVDMYYIACGTAELIDRVDYKLAEIIKDRYQAIFTNYENLFKSLLHLTYNKIIKDNFEALFHEVNLSNHSKADADGNPIFREDGKLLKGENFFEPRIREILFY